MKEDHDISRSRATGRFLGFIWGAVKSPVESDRDGRVSKDSKVVNQQVEESEGELNGQKVILRRTTIEEIEIQEDPKNNTSY